MCNLNKKEVLYKFPTDFAVLYDGNETMAAVWAQILQTIYIFE